MIRALTTLVYGIAMAVSIVVVAAVAAIWVIGMAAKAALFGEPRATLAMKIVERMMRERKVIPTDITHITSYTEGQDQPNDGGNQ